jgi:peptidoglycan-N-acetylglucosamine deacetylase
MADMRPECSGKSTAQRIDPGNGSLPVASISIDLDNQWSYMKIHGDRGWENYPSYLDIFVPHVLDLLDSWNLKITFFIVGIDAHQNKNRAFLKKITDRGHEVGNHSLNHESWLQKYSREQLVDEIREAEQGIVAATGKKPLGFRGPGFSWSVPLLEILAERNYLFDASTLPTYIGPLARMYYFWKSDLSRAEKMERNELFGSMKNGLQPLNPFQWLLPSGKTILEIPVTTIPVIKTPFHLSYLLYLSRYSILLMRLYLALAIGMCKIKGTSPSYLLHPLDLIGGDKITDLAFFPGMDLTSERKAQVFNIVIATLGKYFNLVSMGDHARHLARKSDLNLRRAD